MLYDNSTPEKSVASWILEETKTGRLDVTSGYFTVGILSFISRHLNQNIEAYRFVLGDIVCNDQDKEKPINLLTETITVDAALELNKVAREAVAFLRHDNVKVRTVEPNFCHAKTILFRTLRSADSYFVTGSSNLTEAGLGLQHTSNIELNVVGQGTASDYNEICQWFDELWQRDQTQDFKTVEGKKVPFKQYLISQIEGIFRLYTPRELYFKTLFELFRDQMLELENNPELQQRIGHLKHTKIFRTLFEFQQKGVLSLIKKIEDYQGAILADAVGLGKTWSALAVIKYYEIKGYQCILLCPKKLSHNWTRYLKNRGSIFETDRLDYVVRYHTDLQDNRLESNHNDGLTLENFFQTDKPKLYVIDESHNLRNSKSGRYRYLVEKLLANSREVRVLLLSATPINNDFKDLRNQLALLVKDQDKGFTDARGIQVESLETQFRLASKAFGEWSDDPKRNIRTLLQKLPEPVTRLIDRIIVARNRRHIKGLSDGLDFPEMSAPVNVCMEALNISEFSRFEQILGALPRIFAAYKPAMYLIQPTSVSVLEDEAQRDQALVVMLNKLLVKRLESSWQAFHQTLRAVRSVHDKTLTAVEAYRQKKQDTTLVANLDSLNTTEDEFDFPLGRREIRISEIEAAGTLDAFHDHLKEDLARLDSLIAKLDAYAQTIATEDGKTSADPKVCHLFKLCDHRLSAAPRPEKRRVLIFTSYEDTARYLFGEFARRGYKRIAMVSGSGARLSEDPDVLHKNFEPLLERFCPYTKLYREKEWPAFDHPPKESNGWEAFDRWKSWVRPVSSTTAEKLDTPVEILIATDCLSEGQNLQDCDTVINYDIHWNPVRLIQRLGRIDRIGSPNTTVTGINFWPTATVNEYLGLQKRVEDRAIAIAVAGSEVPSFTEKVRERLQDESFQEELEARMLSHLETSWDDLEHNCDTLDFSDLSLEVFRQDLLRELGEHQKQYADMPLGVYTGFQPDETTRPDGIVALLGYPSRKNGARSPYRRHNLVYLDLQGNVILDRSADVLKFLADHQSHDRSVPQAIDENDPVAIRQLSSSIKTWLASFSTGDALDDLLVGIQGSDPAKKPLQNDGKTLEQQYDPENCDLILWFVIHANT